MTSLTATPVSIHWLTDRHVLDVLRTELHYPHPWCDNKIHHARNDQFTIPLVAVWQEPGPHYGRVVGHIVYRLRNNTIDLLRIATNPHFCRRGVGRSMVERLKAKLATNGRRTRIETRVRETNLGAQHFLAACGLEAKQVLREWWEDSGEDAYLFEYRMAKRTERRVTA